MKRFLMVVLLIVVAAVMATGCASYTVQSVPSQLDSNKIVKNGDSEASITAFPIITEEDSRKYFDDDLVADNILPVYLIIVNHSQS
jgi:hypothetical protein